MTSLRALISEIVAEWAAIKRMDCSNEKSRNLVIDMDSWFSEHFLHTPSLKSHLIVYCIQAMKSNKAPAVVEFHVALIMCSEVHQNELENFDALPVGKWDRTVLDDCKRTQTTSLTNCAIETPNKKRKIHENDSPTSVGNFEEDFSNNNSLPDTTDKPNNTVSITPKPTAKRISFDCDEQLGDCDSQEGFHIFNENFETFNNFASCSSSTHSGSSFRSSSAYNSNRAAYNIISSDTSDFLSQYSQSFFFELPPPQPYIFRKRPEKTPQLTTVQAAQVSLIRQQSMDKCMGKDLCSDDDLDLQFESGCVF